jgi:hypothetical protein
MEIFGDPLVWRCTTCGAIAPITNWSS